MGKILSKFVGVLLAFVLFSSFNLCYGDDVVLPENLKKQMLKLNEEIKKAAASGDIEAYKKVKDGYMHLINKVPELKDALAKHKQISNELLEHKKKAEKYFLQGKYESALKEYQQILLFTDGKDSRKNFEIYRAITFIAIGKIHLKMGNKTMANKAFENALLEKICPTHKNFIEKEIRFLKEELKDKEVIIEFVYYEKMNFGSGEKAIELINKKQLIKRISCLCKFKGKINSVASTQNSYGMLIVEGKAIKEKNKKSKKDYIIFKGKINLSDKDKNWEWEAFPRIALLKGDETYIGGSAESAGETTRTRIITATWCLNKKPN